MPERIPPYLLASSVTAQLGVRDRFHLLPTAKIAREVGADGIQAYIQPGNFKHKIEDVGLIREALQVAGLTQNVAHLPTYATRQDLEQYGEENDYEKGQARDALRVASDLLDPIPDVGKVCVIHHNPVTQDTPKQIIDAFKAALFIVNDPELVIGLEHFHPRDVTTNKNLPEQIDRYLDLLLRMRIAGIPTVAVLDIGRWYTVNAVEPLFLDDEKMKEVCKILHDQQVLVHAADCLTLNARIVHPDNATRIGTGALTPMYKSLVRYAEANKIELIGIVDESEVQTVQSPKDVDQVKEVFR